MDTIASFSDLENYLASSSPIQVCRYKSRTVDISKLDTLLNINGVIPCGIKCLSSPDALKDDLGDKTKVDTFSREIGLPSIPGFSGIIDDFEFSPLAKDLGLPLFLHFAEGSGGRGNYIVDTAIDFERIKKRKKGTRRLNVKQYFHGRSCDISICVTPTSVICGPLEEMLIGAEPINLNPTECVGSSWFENNYSFELRKKICSIGVSLGELMRSKGFLGYFHPDFLVDDNDNVFITELNMRFPGSIGTFTRAEIAEKRVPLIMVHALTFHDPNLQFDEDKLNTLNLSPLDYGVILLNNNFGKPITISHKYRSGLYQLTEQGIRATQSRNFGDLEGNDHIFITYLDKPQDTIIEHGARICRITTRFPTSDTKSKLNPAGKLLVKKVLAQIIVE